MTFNESLEAMEKGDLTIEDFRKMELDEFLIHIKEKGDHTNEITIICMFKVIKQLINETDLETPIVKFRQRFRNENDLEQKLDIIHGFIEHNKLVLNHHANGTHNLNELLKKLEIELERMDYTNLDKINDLAENEKVKHQRAFSDYKQKKELLRKLLNYVCEVYESKVASRFDEEIYHQRFLDGFEKILETKDEAETTSFVSNAQENAMLTYAKRCGMLSDKDVEHLRRKMYKKKVDEFHEKQEQLKEKEKEKRGDFNKN